MDVWVETVGARRSLLATFESLSADQWDAPSLCEEWTIRDVLAHLVLAAKPPPRRYATAVLRTRSFDAANRELAVADARAPVDELLASYRHVIDNRFAPPGWPKAAPLTDIVLHGFDVRIPLGLEDDGPAPEIYEPVMGLLLGRQGGTFVRSGRPKVRWVATDLDWSSGSGGSGGSDDEVRGTMADLALAATGRAVRVDRLTGPGVDRLRSWAG